MKQTIIIFFIAAAAYQWSVGNRVFSEAVVHPLQHVSSSDNIIERSYQKGRSHVQVSGEGTVIKVLRDDNEGSRHQKFILRLSSGQTLLVAHNIDLAPRINSISAGDKVQFNGEYEWNNKGGVVHWTHHDPNGDHAGGWLKHKGKSYE